MARYQAGSPRAVSWDYTIDQDGSVAVSNDPCKYYTWHATAVNGITLGIEMIQDDDGALYEKEIQDTAQFILFLCNKLGIQAQIPWRKGKPIEGIIKRIEGPLAGRDVVGVYGHRNQTTNRGPGDPGNAIFEELARIGFETFDYDQDEDLNAWKARQKTLGIPTEECDGVVGPGTRKRLEEAGYKNGLWINGKTL